MAQQHDIVEKIRLEVDGEQVEGLTKIDAVEMEEELVEVPEFHKKRQISNGVKKIPVLTCTFKVRKDSKTLALLQGWFDNDEAHDVVSINTDADGVEYRRTLYPDAECTKFTNSGAYDAAAPTFAQVNCILVPWDVTRIAS